jgi:hypothetical protein
MSPEEYDRFAKDDPRTKAITELARDAARWRALVASTGNETDMSSGPGKPKDMIVRINCTGCARWLESGAIDWTASTPQWTTRFDYKRHSPADVLSHEGFGKRKVCGND